MRPEVDSSKQETPNKSVRRMPSDGQCYGVMDHLRNALADRNISVSPWPPAGRHSRNLVELSTSPKTVLYIKEFNDKGPGFWGLTANQVDRLEKASVRWFSVLLLRSAVAGYVLTASDVNNCWAGAKLAKGDFKVREGKPAQGFQSA